MVRTDELKEKYKLERHPEGGWFSERYTSPFDLEAKSFMKKFKDKKFAAKCNRETIKKGCEMLGMDVKDVAEICIKGMKPHAEEIGLLGTGAES